MPPRRPCARSRTSTRRRRAFWTATRVPSSSWSKEERSFGGPSSPAPVTRTMLSFTSSQSELKGSQQQPCRQSRSQTVSACSTLCPCVLRTQATGKDKMFQPILEKIDKAFPDRPVFVFGYSQLMRGLSCACNFAPLCALNLHLTSHASHVRPRSSLQVSVKQARAVAFHSAARWRDVDLPPRAGRWPRSGRAGIRVARQ